MKNGFNAIADHDEFEEGNILLPFFQGMAQHAGEEHKKHHLQP